MNSDVTELLLDVSAGDKNSTERLFTVVYDKLRLLAGAQLNREFNEVTFQQTELVHEAFLKIVDQDRITLNDRKHFYGIASKCMRQILVDHARKKKAEKRGGNQFDVTFDQELQSMQHVEHLIEIDQLLDELQKFDQRLAKVVEYKFFGGLSMEHISEILDVSEKTVSRDWQHAKAWLYKKIKSDGV